jgi:DNA replication licensing factor MCM2
LRKMNLNTMIKIRGVVTRRSQVFSQLKKIWFICTCGEKKGPLY